MIQAPSLAFPNIRHAFFTREGGVSDGIYQSLNGGIGSNDAPDNVRENRARMAAALGVAPTHLVTCYQIHSPDVIVAETPWTRENAPRADAIVTRVPGLAIGVSTADCGPVLFADGEAGVVGAAHAGWKGALTGVLEATIAAMEKLGAQRARIGAAIGPLIRQPNYEVGAGIRRSLHGGGRRERALLRAGGARRPRDVRPARLHQVPARTRWNRRRRRPRACAPMRTRRASSATAVPPIGASRTTDVTSMRLRLMQYEARWTGARGFGATQIMRRATTGSQAA